MNELRVVLALLLQGIRTVSAVSQLVAASHPHPLTHVVRSHPRQIANPIDRPHNVRLEHERRHNVRTLKRSRGPRRIHIKHRALRSRRTGERLNQRVLASPGTVSEPRREQIRNMPEVLDDPIRTNPLQELRPIPLSHLRIPQILPELSVVLRDPLARLQTNVQRKHRTIAAVTDEPTRIRIRRTILDQRRSRTVQHLLRQLTRRLRQHLTHRPTLHPRQLVHTRRNRRDSRETRIRHRLQRKLRVQTLIPSLPSPLRPNRQLLQVHPQERLHTMIIRQIILTQHRPLQRKPLRTPSLRVEPNRHLRVRHITRTPIRPRSQRDRTPLLRRHRLDARRQETRLSQTSTLRILAPLNHVQPHRPIRSPLVHILRQRLSRHRKRVKHIGTCHGNFLLYPKVSPTQGRPVLQLHAKGSHPNPTQQLGKPSPANMASPAVTNHQLHRLGS